MKIALFVLLGLVLVSGRRGPRHRHRARLVELFKTTNFEGYSGALVFFTFMPLGAAIGDLAVRCCSA
jgi:hypothetical protein